MKAERGFEDLDLGNATNCVKELVFGDSGDAERNAGTELVFEDGVVMNVVLVLCFDPLAVDGAGRHVAKPAASPAMLVPQIGLQSKFES